MKMVDLEHDDDFTSVAYKTNTNFKQMSWQFDRLLKRAIKGLRDTFLKIIDMTKQECNDLVEQATEGLEDRIKTLEDKIDEIEDKIEEIEDTIETLSDDLEALDERVVTLETKIEEVKIPIGSYSLGWHPNYTGGSSWSYRGSVEAVDGSTYRSISVWQRDS